MTNAEVIIEYLEERIACYDLEHPGYEKLKQSAENAISQVEDFDIDNPEHFNEAVTIADGLYQE